MSKIERYVLWIMFGYLTVQAIGKVIKLVEVLTG